MPPESGQGLPLKAARKLAFSTDEGTWMSVDVSPDGKTVLFDLLGHLYTVSIEGGTATALTNGLGFDGQPRYSPDGKRIVFVSDRSGDDNIWIANADGSSARALTAEDNTLFTSPCWTPDGNSILVSKKKPHFYNSAFEVWRYDLAGGSGLQITRMRSAPGQGELRSSLGVTASADQRYLYFARRVSPMAPAPGRLVPWQIVRRDLTSGGEDTLTAIQGSAFRPLLSPDGRKLIYGTRYDAETALRIRDLASGEERWLKYPVQHDDLESAAARDLLPAYTFLPGGREILIAYGGKLRRLNIETGEDRVIPFEAKISRDLGPKLDFPRRLDEGPVRARVIQSASLSPDGRRIAFSALTRVYIADASGASARRLIQDDSRQYEPVWSPDGQWIAYSTWSAGQGAVWKSRADGTGTPQRLTDSSAYYRYLAWSPDSTRIVALRTHAYQALSQADEWGRGLQTSELISIPPTGGTATVIAAGEGFSHAHFTDEPDRIYITVSNVPRALSADCDLVSLRWDGTDRRTHLKVKGKDIWGADFSPVVRIMASPDRSRALILFRSQLYLASMPKIGGETPVVDVNAPATALARLTTTGADEARWAIGGSTATWSLGASFFSLPVTELTVSDGEKRFTASWAKRLRPQEIAIHIEMPRHKPQGTIVLRGARVITMRGDEVLASADVLVKDNRIAAVGTARSITAPAGAKVLDLTGYTIIPGMIDAHAHWFEIRRGVLDLPYWGYLATLAYGITTGRDPQTLTPDMFVYQDMVDSGETIGPRAYSTGPGIFWTNDFQSADEAADVVSRYSKYYRTHMVKSYMVGSRRQRQFVVEACNRLQMMPTTEGAADMALDLTHALDGFGGLEHQLPIVPIYKDVVTLMAQSGIYYTPTYIIGGYGGPPTENFYYQTSGVHEDPKVRRFIPHNIIDAKATRIPWYRPDEYVHARAAEGTAAIVRAGGKVCVGGHGEFQGLSFHWELWSLHGGKLTNMEALRAATLHGAEAIGLAQDLGSIEVGKLADLVVLKKNPLADIRNTIDIEYVMKDGELFAAGTLDQVWPKEKKLAPLWWWKDQPDSR